jgi:hypothetical protein
MRGPTLAGLNANWQRWSLPTGALAALVPPCLGEDPDDLAYAVRSGLVVTTRRPCGLSPITPAQTHSQNALMFPIPSRGFK